MSGIDNITNTEELSFIFQAAVAPISIARRMIKEGKSFGRALFLTIDRDAYVQDLRSRKPQ